MLDIIIKSFNRPYYLERCLRSIEIFVEGSYRVTIVDDGTPSIYLDKIQIMFPSAIIKKSPLYPKKEKALEDHFYRKTKYDLFTIPVSLWIEAVNEASEFFLLLEDDIWLHQSIDVDEVIKLMQKDRLSLLKLWWGGNEDTIYGEKKVIGDSIVEIIPNLPVNSPFLLEMIFKNTFKLRFLLEKIGLIKEDFNLPYYSLYSVTSAIFEKKYWLNLWKDTPDHVNENYQLLNAAKYSKDHGKLRVAKSFKEITKTSFITSATNNFKGVDFDIIVFNHYLNKAWLEEVFDPMIRFPNDFQMKDIISILDDADDCRSTSSSWKEWVKIFKSQYIKFGCNVE